MPEAQEATEVRDQIVELAKTHRTTEIAKVTGKSRQWVTEILKREKVVALGHQLASADLKQRNQKIVSAFNDGAEVPAIAREVDLSADHVRRILREHNVSARSRSEQKQRKIIEMYVDEVPLRDIQEALNVSRRWISKVVQKHGVPLRTASA